MNLTKTPKEFLKFVNDNNGSPIRVLFQGGTGCGKTTLISYLPKYINGGKILFITLSPSKNVSLRIKHNQSKLGVTSYTFSEFRDVKPLQNVISIVDTHASINSESSKLHLDGDDKGVLTLLHEYSQIGYNIILSIDESGIFVTDKNNETVKIIKKLPINTLELHFSATPDLNIEYDKIFVMDDVEVKKTKRVKNNIMLLRLGHTDDYETVNDVINKLFEIEPFYNGNTVTAQFVCEKGSDFKVMKKIIHDVCRLRGIKEDEIFDLSVVGKSDNVDGYETFTKEISENTKHKYKIILTKYAGTIGFDCPSISILALMRNLPKSAEKQKIQIIGRAKRTFNGSEVENEVQDTVFLFIKDDFILPSYMMKEILNQEKTVYELKNPLKIDEVKIIKPIVETVNVNKNFKNIDKILLGINYNNIRNQIYTLTTMYYITDNLLSGDTINNVEKDSEKNFFDKISLCDAIDFVDRFENNYNTILEGSFNYFLSKLGINKKQLVVDVAKNLKVRELVKKTLDEFKKINKTYKVCGSKEYIFPKEILRHKSNIVKYMDEDTLFYDKVLYSDCDNKVYFDSKGELKFFDEIISRKKTDWVFQNPRTNQGGISFYIPEYDVNHSPDYIISYNGRILFVEITSWNMISEKEKFIKSEGVPNNYMLVVINNQENLVTLLKDEYEESSFLNNKCWININQRYGSL